jgi:RNA polymerase sigma-70 factor (ECF subfamily)
VVVLRFLEGWENDEVSAALHKPVSAVKALQHRALMALRKMLLGSSREEGLYVEEY